jgi:hypothetical protein
MMKKILIALSLLIVETCWAVDIYDPFNNQLKIPSVQVGAKKINNVVVTVGKVLNINGGMAVGTIDTYEPNTNVLTIPSVLVGATTYTNVTINVGSIVSVGLPPFSTSYQNAKGPYATPITFPPSLIDPLNGPPIAYAIGDFFQTGNIDLFTARQNYYPSRGSFNGVSQADAATNPIYLSDFTFWRKQSDGTYSKLLTLKGCLHPRKAIVADFNQDTFPDVYIACTGYDSGTFPGEQSKLLLSDRAGNFIQLNVDSVGIHHASAAADVNGDGYPDILSTEFTKTYFLINNKDGTFIRDETKIIGDIRNRYATMEILDLDNDGYNDLVVGLARENDSPNSTKILYGDKNGKFGQRYSVIPSIPGRGGVMDFTLVQNNGLNSLYVNRTADGKDSVCYYCSTTLQLVNLTDMTSKIVLDNIYKQIGPYYMFGPSWTPWWLPSSQNGQNGVVPYWTTTNTFVYQ